MATNITTQPTLTQGESWFESFKRRGFYFQYVAIATIIGGLYAHITRLFLGDDLLLRYIMTPRYDQVLTIPMTYAAVTGLLVWRRIQFNSAAHKIACGLALFYIAASVPLHLWNIFVTRSVEYLRVFPIWWTIVLLPIYAGIIVLMWRLRYKEQS